MHLKKNLLNQYKITLFLFFNFLLLQNNIIINRQEAKNTKRIGIIGFISDNNIGNNLVKYSMFVVLRNYGFKPVLIVRKNKKNIYFLRKYIKINEIKDYKELKRRDYDMLVVNSDQTWNYRIRNLLNIGFLYFAKNWNIPKFVYAASLAHSKWEPKLETLNLAKDLVKKFSDISVREYGSIDIVYRKLGVKPKFVLDPTFLLTKRDYLKLINNFRLNIDLKENYFCTYILDKKIMINNFARKASLYMNYKILDISCKVSKYIEKFIFSINICKSILTDSFHGTVFSIIFNKPFITFINARRGIERFISLNQTFDLNKRIVFPKKFERSDAEILKTNPNINKTKFHTLRRKSFDYLKKNLGII